MGFTEVLTVIFIVLKIAGVIKWSWLLVFTPEIVALVFYILFFVLYALCIFDVAKEFKKIMKE